MTRTKARSKPRARRLKVARLGRPTAAIGLLLAGSLLGSAFVTIEAQRNTLAREASALQSQIAANSAQLARSQAGIAEKQTDAYVTDKARAYGYVKPGEALIGVQRDPAPATVALSVDQPTRMQRWLALFFGQR
ncbi:MAG TPA: hypothetical protein VHG53_03120 [Candidatus Limnocylindria bacterium]|nr:hypothetical protein [Candidatus Limnocylindria bacterium]